MVFLTGVQQHMLLLNGTTLAFVWAGVLKQQQ
jgi:hypothetical protein